MKWPIGLLWCAATAGAMSGCMVPAADFNAAQTQNRALTEQNRALLAEAENRNAHTRDLEDRLIRSEKQLASLQDRADLDQKQLDGYQHEREELYAQFKEVAHGRGRLPAELNRQLTDLSRRYPNLQFDPETGVSKLDTDILFDSGEAVLKPDATMALDELVGVLKSPAAEATKIMVAGHTDNQPPVGKMTRQQYSNNFHLSAARALAVADHMKRGGLPDRRIGVAGFGADQPIASNATAQDRRKNRRVEIFVLSPDTPVIGWTESTPTVYSASRRSEPRQ
jgi:chemotaxis protein MotB